MWLQLELMNSHLFLLLYSPEYRSVNVTYRKRPTILARVDNVDVCHLGQFDPVAERHLKSTNTVIPGQQQITYRAILITPPK